MTKRQESAQATRRKLIEATKEIVRAKGLAETTIEEICSSCGVAKGTFYTYFRKKEDVLSELNCHEAFQTLLQDAKEQRKSFQERLTFYMCGFASLIEESGLKLCQEWVRNTATPEFALNSAGIDKLRLDRAQTLELFSDGVSRGELRSDAPIESLADLIVDLLYGQMLCWVTSDGERGFAERTREFCQTQLGTFLQPWLN